MKRAITEVAKDFAAVVVLGFGLSLVLIGIGIVLGRILP